jgi:hydroxyacylglutathione hydrolase
MPEPRLIAVPALSDNYIWVLAGEDGRAVVVDPGEAAPAIACLEAERLVPAAVLLTHHHDDHVGGVPGLLARWPDVPVHAPDDPRIATATRRVVDGDRVEAAGMAFDVLATPGHTVTHVTFLGPEVLFCGDTLFSLGAGRLFEGTPGDMLASLDRLAALPAGTRVCCGHEYTSSNAAFARVVDPSNPALRRRSDEVHAMRAQSRPTLPARLGDETACNPFLRVDAPAVRASVEAWAGTPLDSRVDVFAALRRWKDGFRA